jgi:hypothetical protein
MGRMVGRTACGAVVTEQHTAETSPCRDARFIFHSTMMLVAATVFYLMYVISCASRTVVALVSSFS